MFIFENIQTTAMKQFFLSILFCSLSLFGWSQTEVKQDSLIIRQDRVDEFINQMNAESNKIDFTAPPTVTPSALSDSLRMPKFDFTIKEEMPRLSPFTFNGNPFAHDYMDGRAYQINENAILSGNHSYTNLPTIGEMRNANVMFTQQLNDYVSLTGGVYAAKYNMYGARFNDIGTNGKLSVRLNDRMKINMFGTYSIYNGYGMTPATQPYMNQTSFGGTFEFRITDRFGLEVGAEREFNPRTRKWETHPIINPVFYKD